MSSLLKQGKGGGRKLSKAGEADPAAIAPDKTMPSGTPAVEDDAQNGASAAVAEAVLDPRRLLELLPQPYESTNEGELDEQERALLQLCEGAISNLRVAFWVTGKALELVLKAQLYRGPYPTFEAYLVDRWDMRTSQAYRLIQEWRLGEHMLKSVSPNGDKIIFNEAQVRVLLPVARRYDESAAVTVYETVAGTDDVRVTADVLKGAVSVLPEVEEFDADTATARIRAFLAGELQPPAEPVPSPDEVFVAEVTRVREALRRRANGATPAVRRRYAAELRELADELEKVE